MEPVVDKLSEDMEKIRGDQEELRKSILSLQKDELLPLDKQVDALDSKYKQAIAYVTAILLAFSALGYTKFEDVNKSLDILVDMKLEKTKDKYANEMDQIKKTFETKSYEELTEIKRKMAETENALQMAVNDTISFNETLQTTVQDNPNSPKVLLIYKKLARLKPNNETVFVYFTDHCYRKDKYNDAIEHLEYLREKSISPDDFRNPASLFNAGVFLWIRSFHEASTEGVQMALRCLERARASTEPADDVVARRSWYFLALLHLSQNRCSEAEACASRHQEELEKTNCKENLLGDTKKEWFKLLEKRCNRPILQDLEKMFPGCFSEEKSVAILQ
jgi:hypothetical protein